MHLLYLVRSSVFTNAANVTPENDMVYALSYCKMHITENQKIDYIHIQLIRMILFDSCNFH